MQSEIILLSNVKQDGLAQIVQNQFRLLGITNVKGKRIDADGSAIKAALSSSLTEYNVIMIIGGVGFNDDTTVTAVSETIGFSTVLRDGQKFPKGAEILHNHEGCPSGCVISQGNQCIIMLPGDRETIEFLLCYRVTEYLSEFTSEHFFVRTLRCSGITRYYAERAVADGGSFGTQSMVFEDKGEIAVQVLSHGSDTAQAKERNSSAVRNMIAALGSCVYAIDAENIGQALKQELDKKGLMVSIAVDGMTKDRFGQCAYITEYLDNTVSVTGDIECYDIPEKLIKRYGRNSDWAAAVMAGEASKVNGANIGMAVTADRTRVGEGAHVAVCMGDNVWTEKVNAGNFDSLCETACSAAAHLARKVVSAYPKAYDNAVSLVAAASGKSKFSTVSSGKDGRKWYARFIPMKGDTGKETARKLIFITSILVFLGCMGFLSTKAFDAVEHRSLAANLNGLFGNTAEEDIPDEWPFLASLYDLYQENEDLIGYIQIDDTNVSFPVVQTMESGNGGETGQYYLRKDYYGNYSMYGTPFLDYRCAVNPSYATNNLIIYGHNIYNDGQMFSDLLKYRKLAFYKNHPVVQFDSLYGEGDYLIIGVVLANAYAKDGPVWGYNNFIDGTESETKEFITQIAKRTLIVTGVDYNTSDTFLTLSTCCYDFKDARFVVIARKLRDGETLDSFDFTKAYYSSNPLMPDKWYQALAEKQQSESDASFGSAQEPQSANDIVDVVADTSGMKTEYVIGEKLDLTGIVLVVTKKDADGNTYQEEIEADLVYDAKAFKTSGEQTITLEYEGMEFDIVVVVNDSTSSSSSSSVPASSAQELTVKSGKIDTSGGKTKYAQGESFDPSGINLILTMSDGSNKTVAISSLTCSGFDSSTVGDKTITVKYDKDHSYTFKVTITEAAVSSISISKGPNKTEYTVGDKFDSSGIELKVKYSNGKEETVTTGFTVGSPNMSNASEQSVTVTYKGATTTFKVTIKAASSSSTPEPSSTPESSSIPESSSGSESSSEPESSEASESGSEGNSSNAEQEVQQIAQSPKLSQAKSVSSTSSGNESSYYEDSLTDTISVNGTTMSIYEAVCRVVRYEAGVGQPDEHVKAQAVATYTYLKNQGSPTGVGMKAMSTVSDQIKRCVAEVIGYAILDDSSNKYILSTYFSESPGYSADAEWVWGYANRNLKSVRISVDDPDGYEYSISSSAFATLMGTGFDFSGDPSDWIEILNYEGSTPYVKQVRVGGITIKARALREKYIGLSKLRSTAFEVEYDEDSDKFVFTSYGYGHGVGMSAKASIAYAKQGYDWDEILLKFYSNCYIKMKY